MSELVSRFEQIIQALDTQLAIITALVSVCVVGYALYVVYKVLKFVETKSKT